MTLSPVLANRIRTLSVKKVIRKLKDCFLFASYVLVFPVAYLSVVIYSKLVHVDLKFSTLYFSSIGHSLKVDGFARRVRHRKLKSRFIFVSAYQKIINPYFYEVISRKFLIIRNPLLGFFLTSLIRMPNSLNFNNLVGDLTLEELNYEPVNWFDEDDEIRGRQLLEKLGIGENGWYVCFFARDNAYNEIYNSGDERDYNLTYHSIRNSDISTYESAMRFILDRGGVVLRMGMVAHTPVGFSDPNLIDYPFSSLKSDFADVYLMCHAKFVIGCSAGIVDLSSITNTPLGSVNCFLPWIGLQRKNVIYIPKLLRYIESGKYLTLHDHNRLFGQVDSAIEFAWLIKKYGLCVVNNSGEDILMVVEKMYENFVETQIGFELSLGEDNKILVDFLTKYPYLDKC